jgi:type I restriction enzyme S subunit
MSVAAFASYMNSGIDSLGTIPSHWEAKPVYRVASYNDEVLPESTSPEHEIEYVEISGVDPTLGVTERQRLEFGLAPSRARRVVREDDVLVSTVRTYLRAIAPVHGATENLVASTGFCVIRARAIDARFLGYALRSEDFISQVIARSVGVSYPAINASDLVRIPVAVPPQHEQRAISSFLDRETAKIDALVEEQQHLIALLDEKRQAVVSHAVTQGLDPDAPMKDSGVEWLGQVPARWRVCRLKHIAEVRGRIGFRGYTSEDLVEAGDGALALGGANIGDNGQLSLANTTYLTWEKYEESPEIKISRGDILLGQRGTCGKCALVASDIGPATINPSLVVLKEITSATPEFLALWISGSLAQRLFDSYLSKTAVPMLTQQQIENIPVVVPPEGEQERIVEFVEQKTSLIDELRRAANDAVALLKERRSALISAAVTGKIDVRGLVEDQAEAA